MARVLGARRAAGDRQLRLEQFERFYLNRVLPVDPGARRRPIPGPGRVVGDSRPPAFADVRRRARIAAEPSSTRGDGARSACAAATSRRCTYRRPSTPPETGGARARGAPGRAGGSPTTLEWATVTTAHLRWYAARSPGDRSRRRISRSRRDTRERGAAAVGRVADVACAVAQHRLGDPAGGHEQSRPRHRDQPPGVHRAGLELGDRGRRLESGSPGRWGWVGDGVPLDHALLGVELAAALVGRSCQTARSSRTGVHGRQGRVAPSEQVALRR